MNLWLQVLDSYLMDSLVALSLTVEEKEEWVLSSNRKDSGGFTASESNGKSQKWEEKSQNTPLKFLHHQQDLL